MKIQQLRNATIILEFGEYRVLVDPMLSPKNALPPLKLSGGMLRNPTVSLPSQADMALLDVTHCLITHCQKGHFDHLDRTAIRQPAQSCGPQRPAGFTTLAERERHLQDVGQQFIGVGLLLGQRSADPEFEPEGYPAGRPRRARRRPGAGSPGRLIPSR